MPDQYLLPCSCGRQIVVEPRQAGETVTCSCGVSLAVPTLLAMRKLEAASFPAAPHSTKTAWGLGNQFRLLGIALILVAVGGCIWLYAKQPKSGFEAITPDLIRQDYKKFTPAVTWDGWNFMQKGLDRRIDQAYVDAVLRFRVWQIVVGVVALCGIALIAAGFLGTQRKGLGIRD